MRTVTWGAGLLAVALQWGVVLAQEPVLQNPAEPAPQSAIEQPLGQPIVTPPAVPNSVLQPLIPQANTSSLPASTVPLYRPYREETQTSTAQRMIHERAMYRARQRTARLESMKWVGVSSSRPTISMDFLLVEQNPVYAGFYGGTFYQSAGRKSPWSRY